MANINLGPAGAMLTLAHTLTDSLPTKVGKRIESYVMSNGSVRYSFFADQRRWSLAWPKLTAAQLAVLETLRAYNQSLTYQNNDESTTIYTVVITAFSYDVINPMGTPVYYTATMALEEVV